MLRPLACLALSIACLAHAAQADVLVVDWANGPGSDHEFLWEALDVAQDGDVLLIRPGWYEAYSTIDARSLTLVADGGTVDVVGTLTVRNLAPGQRVVLRGLTLGYPGALELYDNGGVVYVEDCTILADQASGPGQHAGILAEDSRLVVRGSVVAGSMNYAIHETPPTPGLKAVGSVVVLSDSIVRGGEGTDPYAASVPGAAGLSLHGSSVTALGCAVSGGFGDTASGGPGLVANGSSLHAMGTSVEGGPGTPAGDAQLLDGRSSVLALPGAALALSSVSPVREGEALSLTLQGPPGQPVWLALSIAPGWQPTGNGHFVLAVGAPVQLVPLGSIGPDGVLSLSATVPSLGASLQALEVFLQVLHVEAGSGLKVCGPATVVTLLDAAS